MAPTPGARRSRNYCATPAQGGAFGTESGIGGDTLKSDLIAAIPSLRAFAVSICGNADRADDLVQETCLRALTYADQWQPGTRLDSWMYRIAQNLWLDRARATKVRGECVDIDTAIELVGTDGREVTESRLTLATVAKHMEKLSEDQQLLITLVSIDGLSYKEAAEALNVPIGTVMSRLARARRALYDSMTDTSEKPLPAALRKEPAR